MMGRWVAGVVILFGILLLMLPSRDKESLSKIASASMLMCSKDFRDKAATQLLNHEPATAQFTNKCPDLIASLEMDEQGTMVIVGKSHPITMKLHPVIEGGTIRWSCRGKPANEVTKLCKP